MTGGLHVPERVEEIVVDHEGPEPKAKTLILFGVGLLLTIIAIIVAAALLGS